VKAIFPTDPQSGGTWIAVNEVGVVLLLLNRQEAIPAATTLRSRGTIVPFLTPGRSLSEVSARLRGLNPAEYAGFQLIAIHDRQFVLATNRTRAIRIAAGRLHRPFMFTSSSIGDAAAERVRRPLFETLVVHADDALTGQRLFHDHHWPACPSLSVRMRRADARTVSRSIVDVDGDAVSFAYEPFGQS
jgi:hypothetical protein